MVQIIKNFEQKVMERLARRGCDEEEFKIILGDKSRISDVTVLKKRSFGQNSLRDFIKTNYC